MSESKITVVGSLNMDLVVVTDQHPEIGETIIGKDFTTTCGGKGANQAVALKQLGNDVTFIGRVGEDLYGTEIVENFKSRGIKLADETPAENVSTGIACVTVGHKDNSIIIVPGANAHVTPEFLDLHKNEVIHSDYVLTQLEIPIETVDYLATICKENNIPLIVNPAPASALTNNILEACTYITPNRIELEQLKEYHRNIMDYKKKIIVTDGKEGCFYHQEDEVVRIPSFKAEVVDTTGAGDSFNGALVSELSRGKSLEESLKFANATGAASITKFGAQSGMPTREEVLKILEEAEYKK